MTPLARWFFEPGHTAAEFSVRHMSSVEIEIDAGNLWTGEPDRDAHLRSADFLDVEHFHTITFRSREVSLLGGHDYLVLGDLSIRGATRPCTLRVTYLGQWQTPWWENGLDKGPRTRAGFEATTTIDRKDFGVGWNARWSETGASSAIWSKSPSMPRQFSNSPKRILCCVPVNQTSAKI